MALSISLSASAATTTVVVTGDTAAGNNQPGWLFNRDLSTSTPYEFNTDEASIGVGSLYVEPIANNNASGLPGNNPNKDKFIAEYFYLDEVAGVNSISYDFLTDNASDADQFYMNLYVNDGSDPIEFYDCRYNVVPTTLTPDPVTGFTTVTYDLGAPASSVDVRGTANIACPLNPADLAEGAVLRAVAINVGDTSASDTGVDGYLDKVVLNTANDVTTFDFEPALSPSDKNECKKDGWKTFNAPAFTNQGQCVSWTNHHDGRGQDDN